MSIYTTVDIEIADLEIAKEVLLEMFGDKLEDHSASPTALFGYGGDDRSKLPVSNKNYAPKCHLVVRRHNLWSAANDFGVYQAPDGKIKLYISSFDSGKGNFSTKKLEEMQNKIKQTYSEKLVMRKAHKAGYRIKKQQMEDGRIRLVMKRR